MLELKGGGKLDIDFIHPQTHIRLCEALLHFV